MVRRNGRQVNGGVNKRQQQGGAQGSSNKGGRGGQDIGRGARRGGAPPGKHGRQTTVPKGRNDRRVGKDRGRYRGREGLAEVIVKGFKQSKAALNPDGGIQALVEFLERKSDVYVEKVSLTYACSFPVVTGSTARATPVCSRFKSSPQNDDRDARALPLLPTGDF